MTLGKVKVLAESGAGFPARLTASTEGEGSLSAQKRSAAGQPVTGCPAALLGSLPHAPSPSAQGQTPAHAVCPQRAKHPSSPPFWGHGEN